MYFHDGINFVENALRMGSGTFTYYGYGHGTFFSILLFMVYGLMFLFQLLSGTIHTKEDFLLQYISNPAYFHLMAKLLVILLGTLSIVLTYFIAKKLFNNKDIALLSAFIVGFTFPTIQMSSLVKADNLALFFLLMSTYFSVSIFNSDKRHPLLLYALSGFFIGLSAAAKYPYVLGASILFTAHVVKSVENTRHTGTLIRHLFHKSIFLGLFSLLVGFFSASPFVLKDWNTFLSGTLSLKSYYGSTIYTSNMATQIFFFRHSLGLLIFILIICSFIFILIKDVKKACLIFTFPVSSIIFFYFFASELHYFLPTVPFFGISVSYLCWHILRPIKKEHFFKLCLIILGILIVWPSFLSSLRLKKIMTSPDTRDLAKEWIEKNIDAESVILVEGTSQDLLVFSPQLNANVESLLKERDDIISKGGKGRLFDTRIKWLVQHSEVKSFYLHKVKAINRDSLKKTKPDVVILTGAYDVEGRSWINTSVKAEREKARIVLNDSYTQIKEFNAFPKFSFLFPMVTKDDFLKLNTIGLFDSTTKWASGYDIYVYKRKQEAESPL